jgi:HK97 family phage major capsid protein
VAQLLQVSRELLADSAADVEGFVAIALARNLEVKVGPWLTAGTGTTEPIGYLHGAGTAVTGGTGVAGRPTYENLVDLYGSLDAKYRRSATWLMADSALTAVRRMTDTSGAPIWAPAANGNPETLLGHPVVVDPYLPALGTASKSIVFGDPTAYAVRIADGGVDLEASRDYAFNQDLTTFRAVLRIDAAPLANDAFKCFRGGTA